MLYLRALTAQAAQAPVVELVDALDSKSSAERRAGSSPAWGTNSEVIFAKAVQSRVG